MFDDADFLAFGFGGLQNFFGEFGADFVQGDDLGGHAKNVGTGTIIFRERDAVRRGVLALFPPGKALEEKLEAAERGAAKTVNGLVIVADDEDVASVGAEQVQELELSDVGVLKFVDE